MIIKFKKLYNDAKPPTRAKLGDAGYDLSYHSSERVGAVIIHKLGIAVEIPEGYFGLLRPRSSICKTGYSMASSGIIDSGYRGELMIPLRWHQCPPEVQGSFYETGDRVAQLIILPLPEIEFQEVTELSESDRGNGGFGSTGR